MSDDRTSGSSTVVDDRWMSRRAAIAATGLGVATAALAQSSPAHDQRGKLAKEVVNLGVPWDEQYGHAQAVRIGDTTHVSSQLSHPATWWRLLPSSQARSHQIPLAGRSDAGQTLAQLKGESL